MVNKNRIRNLISVKDQTAFNFNLIVVRHAESVANTKGIFQGQTYDTDLSKLGAKQAEALAQKLKNKGIRKIIASPLKRTYQTAFELSKLTGIPIETDLKIIETNHGIWEGKDKRWIGNNFSDLYKLWMEKPSLVQFPEGEHFLDTIKRVENFFTINFFNENTLIVTHDNIVRIMASLADGRMFDKIWDFRVEPAAINYFVLARSYGKNRLKVLKLNETGHLKNLQSNTNSHAL